MSNLEANNPFAVIEMLFISLANGDEYLEVGQDRGAGRTEGGHPYVSVRVEGNLVQAATLVLLLQKAVKLHAIREVTLKPTPEQISEITKALSEGNVDRFVTLAASAEFKDSAQ